MACAFTGNTLSERLLHHNDLSYGTYIYHMPLINILVEKGYTGDPRWILVVVSGTLALAFLSWKLVEKPALRKKTKSLGEERAAQKSST
jgi:peptidoglycan/LPS O-acetylase OafA/YrhL